MNYVDDKVRIGRNWIRKGHPVRIEFEEEKRTPGKRYWRGKWQFVALHEHEGQQYVEVRGSKPGYAVISKYALLSQLRRTTKGREE